MKTSIILIIATFLNTTVLLAEPLSGLVEDVGFLPFLILEIVLVSGIYIEKILRDLHKAFEIDFSNLNIFITKDPDKKV